MIAKLEFYMNYSHCSSTFYAINYLLMLFCYFELHFYPHCKNLSKNSQKFISYNFDKNLCYKTMSLAIFTLMDIFAFYNEKSSFLYAGM